MPTNRPDPFPTTAWLAPPAARALAMLAAMPPSCPKQAKKRRAIFSRASAPQTRSGAGVGTQGMTVPK
jgi:hypothetical protein